MPQKETSRSAVVPTGIHIQWLSTRILLLLKTKWEVAIFFFFERRKMLWMKKPLLLFFNSRPNVWRVNLFQRMPRLLPEVKAHEGRCPKLCMVLHTSNPITQEREVGSLSQPGLCEAVWKINKRNGWGRDWVGSPEPAQEKKSLPCVHTLAASLSPASEVLGVPKQPLQFDSVWNSSSWEEPSVSHAICWLVCLAFLT